MLSGDAKPLQVVGIKETLQTLFSKMKKAVAVENTIDGKITDLLKKSYNGLFKNSHIHTFKKCGQCV